LYGTSVPEHSMEMVSDMGDYMIELHDKLMPFYA